MAFQCCQCIEGVNEKLAGQGVKLKQYLQFNFETGKASLSNPCIELEKVDDKQRDE